MISQVIESCFEYEKNDENLKNSFLLLTFFQLKPLYLELKPLNQSKLKGVMFSLFLYHQPS